MALQNIKVQVISVTLAIIMSLAYVGNQMAFHKAYSSGRAPASIGSIEMSPPSSIDGIAVENRLAEELAQPSAKRSMASIGAPATELDVLRLGILAGKYSVKMSQGKIEEISIKDKESPTLIPDRVGFLKQFADSLGAASQPKRLSAVTQGDQVIETYRVKTAAGGEKLIQLTLGESHGLLALKTEPAPVLRLF